MGAGARMDVLSDVLHAIRLNGAALFRVSFRAPWSIVTSGGDNLERALSSPVRRIVVFHIVIRGHCWAQLEHGPPQRLGAGEAVVLPRSDVHVLADELGRKPVATEALLHDLPFFELRDLKYGGNGALTEILCGFLICDQTDFEPLFASLPPLLRTSFRGVAGMADLEDLLEHAVREAVSESEGGANSRLRMTELLFVEALRRYMVALPPDQTGWLAGLRDPAVGKVLGLMHDEPCYPWTVSELASRAAVSRSALAARFSALLGVPPMRYLARWRLLLAARELRDSRRSVAAIAASIGYDSPAAFQRAFKRFQGETPAACRRRSQGLARAGITLRGAGSHHVA